MPCVYVFDGGIYSWAQLPTVITLDKLKREVYNEIIPKVNALMREGK